MSGERRISGTPLQQANPNTGLNFAQRPASTPATTPNITAQARFNVEDTIFYCPVDGCINWYFLHRSLVRHVTVTHGSHLESRWTCKHRDFCLEERDTAQAMRQHVENSHGESLPTILPLLGTTPPIPDYEMMDLRLAQTVTKFPCLHYNTCESVLSDADSFVRHLNTRHKILARITWTCGANGCPGVFDIKGKAVQHYKRSCTFPKDEDFRYDVGSAAASCPACYERFASRELMLAHAALYHVGLSEELREGNYNKGFEDLLQVRRAVELVSWNLADVVHCLQVRRIWKHPRLIAEARRKLLQQSLERGSLHSTTRQYQPANTTLVNKKQKNSGIKKTEAVTQDNTQIQELMEQRRYSFVPAPLHTATPHPTAIKPTLVSIPNSSTQSAQVTSVVVATTDQAQDDNSDTQSIYLDCDELMGTVLDCTTENVNNPQHPELPSIDDVLTESAAVYSTQQRAQVRNTPAPPPVQKRRPSPPTTLPSRPTTRARSPTIFSPNMRPRKQKRPGSPGLVTSRAGTSAVGMRDGKKPVTLHINTLPEDMQQPIPPPRPKQQNSIRHPTTSQDAAVNMNYEGIIDDAPAPTLLPGFIQHIADTAIRNKNAECRYQLRVPLFRTNQQREELEAAVAKLVQDNMPSENDAWDELERKNDVVCDQLWQLVQQTTRPKKRPNEHQPNDVGMQDNAPLTSSRQDMRDLSAELRNPALVPVERRRMLRQRKEIAIGRDAQFLVSKYRRRAKQTFDEIVDPKKETPRFTIPFTEVEQYYNNLYSQELSMNGDINDILPLSPNIPSTNGGLSLRTIQEEDVARRLSALKRGTSAGPDGITYDIWKLFPCLTTWLYRVFRNCQQWKRIPTSWKIAKIILLYKKDDPRNCKNWRPISLQNTIGKIYSAVLEKILREVILSNGLLSNNQKGFMPTPGCIEHDYYVHGCIRLARRKFQPLYICSYDFSDAYGSLNHSLVRRSLLHLGFGTESVDLLCSLLNNIGFFIANKNEYSNIIPQHRGVRQGDPISPLLFNLCVEPLSRRLNQMCQEPTDAYNHLLLADDMLTISNNPETCRQLHREILAFCNTVGIKINAEKCRLLATIPHGRNFRDRTPERRVDSKFTLQLNDTTLRPIAANESFRYLGNSVGSHRGGIHKTFKDLLASTKQQLSRLGRSALRIHQKHHAVRTFIIPQWEYFIRLNGLGPSHSAQLGQTLRKGIGAYIGIPASTTTAFYHAHTNDGGLGIPNPWDWASTTQLLHCMGLFNSRDAAIGQLIRKEFAELMRTRYHSQQCQPPDMENINELFTQYLRGDLEQYKQRQYKDHFHPLAQLPKIVSNIGVQLTWNHTDNMVKLQEDTLQEPTRSGPPPANKPTTLLQRLKQHCRVQIQQHWSSLNNQGIGANYNCNTFSNYWLRTDELHPKQYKFAIKSRLNLLPTNSNLFKWKRTDSAACKYCNPMLETTHHLLSTCPAYQQYRYERHNKVLELLTRPARYNYPTAKIFTNQSPTPVNAQQLRPDLVIQQDDIKQVTILDLGITAQSDGESIQRARQRKIDKYTPIKQQYERLGYKVNLDAVIFGDVGGTDQRNHDIIKFLCGNRNCSSPRHYGFRMHRRIITSILRSNYAIWVKRCSSN